MDEINTNGPQPSKEEAAKEAETGQPNTTNETQEATATTNANQTLAATEPQPVLASQTSVSPTAQPAANQPGNETTTNVITPATISQTAGPAVTGLPSVAAIPSGNTQPVGVGQPEKTGAGHIVLQWMTYAFWLWAAWALISLIVSVLVQAIVPATNTGEFSLYALAATLVLLPVATVCDVMYSRTEESQKKGAATAVMLIHAVLFALLAVGSLISAVFALITLIISSGESNGVITWLLSSLFAAVIFGVLFVRTVFGVKIPQSRKIMVIFMIVLTAGFTFAAFIGPVATMVRTKDDKLIRENISTVSDSIDTYVNKNGKLPASLQDVDTSGDAKVLINRQLVTYNPGKTTTAARTSTYAYSSSSSTEYHFTLCATYKSEYNSDSSYYSSDYYKQDDETNASSFYVYSNKKGTECYKLYSTKSNYNNYNVID